MSGRRIARAALAVALAAGCGAPEGGEPAPRAEAGAAEGGGARGGPAGGPDGGGAGNERPRGGGLGDGTRVAEAVAASTGGGADGGARAAGAGGSTGGAPPAERPASAPPAAAPGTFASVKEILGRRCATSGCHDGNPMRVDLRADDGLYERIVRKMPTMGPAGCRKYQIIKPGDHDTSLITIKIEPETAVFTGLNVVRDCPGKMPKGCGAPGGPECLTAGEIGSIFTWVDYGAKP
jgi:hypothetical protein